MPWWCLGNRGLDILAGGRLLEHAVYDWPSLQLQIAIEACAER